MSICDKLADLFTRSRHSSHQIAERFEPDLSPNALPDFDYPSVTLDPYVAIDGTSPVSPTPSLVLCDHSTQGSAPLSYYLLACVGSLFLLLGNSFATDRLVTAENTPPALAPAAGGGYINRFGPGEQAPRGDLSRNTESIGLGIGLPNNARTPSARVDFPDDITVSFNAHGTPAISSLPDLKRFDGHRYYSFDKRGYKVFYSLDSGLQQRAEEILSKHRVSWGALVALEPKTGKILALASHSEQDPNFGPVVNRATFPAASLIKVITASAAVETAGMSGHDLVRFRGGDHTLERSNYLPDARRDRRFMSLEEALGKSVNPVFARLALGKITSRALRHTAESFGFNDSIGFDAPIQRSGFAQAIDDYSYARTAAGFGDVFLSPIHAAVIAATLGNRGTMMRPHLIENIEDQFGRVIYHDERVAVRQSVSVSTAEEVLRMMRATVENGTAKKYFLNHGSIFQQIPVAGKTGTLSGDDPAGRYFWFIGTAPVHSPEIAVAALIIEQRHSRIRGSLAARHLLDYYFRKKFGLTVSAVDTTPVVKPGRGIHRARAGRSKSRVISRGRTAAKQASKPSASKSPVKRKKAKRAR